MRRWGWRRDTPDHRDHEAAAFFGRDIPAVVSLEEWGPRVEDQGPIGSCTAHAATSGLELLASKAGRPTLELSRLYVYWETRVRWERVPPGEDSGAQIRNVVKTLAGWGAPDERLWPYVPARYADPPSQEAVDDAARHRLTGYARCRSLRAVQAALAGGYPVIGGFAVPASIDSEATSLTGIVDVPGPDERLVGGHAVLIVGYDDARASLRFLNSWGPDWGDRGYGWLPYRYVVSGLADDLWALRAET